VMVNDVEVKEQMSLVELKKMSLQLSVGSEGSLLAHIKIRSVL
jgi:hypothetical protein